MEAAFKSRVNHVFGGLLGASLPQGMAGSTTCAAPKASSASSAAASNGSGESWSVSEVAILSNRGRQDAEASSGSDNDEPCAKRYQKFVQLAERARKRRATEDDGLDDEAGWERARNTKRARSGDLEDEASPSGEQQDLEEDEECREMRLMVGMDDTLDYEEEEDEYDKLAVGREGDGERMYMREIKGAGSMADSSTALEFENPNIDRRRMKRDSRANHAAAAARLKEDDRLANTEANKSDNLKGNTPLGSTMKAPLKGILITGRSSKVGNVSSNTSSDNGVPSSGTLGNAESGHEGEGTAADPNSKPTEILNASKQNVKAVKRVRFAPDEKDAVDEKDSLNESDTLRKGSGVDVEKIVLSVGNRKSRVPDYVLNPSKYTHYTLDWSDEEDQTNKANEAAFQATRTLNTPSASDEEMPEFKDLPMGITFVKRTGVAHTNRANGDAKPSTGPGIQQSQALLSFSEDVVTDSLGVAETSVKEAVVESKTTRIFRRRPRDNSDDESVKDSAS